MKLDNKSYDRLRRSICVWGMIGLIYTLGCSSKPMEIMPKIQCRSPNGSRENRAIYEWKYDRVREVILSVLPAGEEGMPIRELREQAAKSFKRGEEEAIGKFSWYVETVSLEMETRGELERFPLTEKSTAPPKMVRRSTQFVP